MNDDERDAMIRRLAQDSLRPPPVPREALWQRIQAARRADQVAPTALPPTRARRWAPMAWPVGIAALLALAFGLGRASVEGVGPASAPAVAGTEAGTTAGATTRRPTAAHRLVAAEYLGRTEVFLTDFRVSARAGQPENSAPLEARRLLGTARLLLDSPAAEDLRLRALLEDLELVLAEIAQLERDGRQDLDLITDGLDQRGTLGRLRAAVPAGGSPAFSQGVL